MESANEDKAAIDPINLTPRERDLKLRHELELEALKLRLDLTVVALKLRLDLEAAVRTRGSTRIRCTQQLRDLE